MKRQAASLLLVPCDVCGGAVYLAEDDVARAKEGLTSPSQVAEIVNAVGMLNRSARGNRPLYFLCEEHHPARATGELDLLRVQAHEHQRLRELHGILRDRLSAARLAVNGWDRDGDAGDLCEVLRFILREQL